MREVPIGFSTSLPRLAAPRPPAQPRTRRARLSRGSPGSCLGGRGGGPGRGVAQQRARAHSSFQIAWCGRRLSVRGNLCFSASLFSSLRAVIGMARECEDGLGRRRGASGEEANGSPRAGWRGDGGQLVNPLQPDGAETPSSVRREGGGWFGSGLKGCLPLRCEFTR